MHGKLHSIMQSFVTAEQFVYLINNFHHIPVSVYIIVNGTYGKRSSAHAQSMSVHDMPQSQR